MKMTRMTPGARLRPAAPGFSWTWTIEAGRRSRPVSGIRTRSRVPSKRRIGGNDRVSALCDNPYMNDYREHTRLDVAPVDEEAAHEIAWHAISAPFSRGSSSRVVSKPRMPHVRSWPPRSSAIGWIRPRSPACSMSSIACGPPSRARSASSSLATSTLTALRPRLSRCVPAGAWRRCARAHSASLR